ncbi:MAG: zinc ribbon domain-containing protein, partial [Myxococcales bacterium]|nr:zinc ribbon domain-containing protein [Myxococcales bacterium]
MPTSCNNCGKENPSGSRFCQSCGTPLAQRPASAEVAAMLVCRSCGTANAPGMKFCKSCGAGIAAQEGKPAKVVCPACGGHTPFGYKFCQHCGSPLPDDAPAAADTKPPTADPEANTNTVISKPTPHKKPAPGGGSEQPTIT